MNWAVLSIVCRPQSHSRLCRALHSGNRELFYHPISLSYQTVNGDIVVSGIIDSNRKLGDTPNGVCQRRRARSPQARADALGCSCGLCWLRSHCCAGRLYREAVESNVLVHLSDIHFGSINKDGRRIAACRLLFYVCYVGSFSGKIKACGLKNQVNHK